MKFLIFTLLLVVQVIACEDQTQYDVWTPQSELELEINELLNEADLYLAQGFDEVAHDFYSDAQDRITHLNSDRRDIWEVRAAFGDLIAQCDTLSEEFIEQELDRFLDLVDGFSCILCSSVYELEVKPILGPDRISINECIKRVKSTEKLALIAVNCLSTSKPKKVLLAAGVIALADKCRDCCRRGGIWKACLKPLVSRWRQLELWTEVGLPPNLYMDMD